MKLERLQEHVPIAATLFFGLWLAFACGYLIGNDEVKTAVTILSLIAAIALLIFARERIWMIIPAFWILGGKVNALPLPFSVAQLAIFFAFGTFLVLKALKVVRFKPKMGFIEVWMLIMLGYILSAFLRNPVGVESLGFDRVGGKPYADIIIVCLAYWVLARVVVTPRQAGWMPLLGLVGSVGEAGINVVAEHVPGLVGPLSNLYSGIAAAEAQEDPLAPIAEASGRFPYLQNLGAGLSNVVFCYRRPLAIVNPFEIRGLKEAFIRCTFLLGLLFVLLSGFRSNLIGVFQVAVLSSWYRRGWGEVVRACAIASAGIVVLVLIQGNVVDLPLSAQRALSFIPFGKWEQAAKSEAEASTEWRVEMWKQMLFTDKYIQNKWLGDGFGFTHYQLETMAANAFGGMHSDAQENLMISGGVHSGPVSTIRFVGYVGLAIFFVLLILIFLKARRLILRSRGTPFFPMALSYGIGAVLMPINFVFIFGAFEHDLPAAIFTIALLRLLENSLDAYEAKEKKPVAEVIQPPKFRPTRPLVHAGGVA
jgi:hypothetical protein